MVLNHNKSRPRMIVRNLRTRSRSREGWKADENLPEGWIQEEDEARPEGWKEETRSKYRLLANKVEQDGKRGGKIKRILERKQNFKIFKTYKINFMSKSILQFR